MAESASVAVVVVDYRSGRLADCLASLVGQGAAEVVVVDNDGSTVVTWPAGLSGRVLRPGLNLGYGAGANRGVAATEAEVVVVANADVVFRPGALAALAAVLLADPLTAVVGPQVLRPDGSRYPTPRRFPSWGDALGHALLGRVLPGNRWSARYRMDDLALGEPMAVDWVSGACLAARRTAWEELGGFDEGYFMYAEDLDLCWRARRSGWQVRFAPAAVVVHEQGASTARRPVAMAVAHHRSALRFAARRAEGWRQLLLPGAAVVLGIRLLGELLALSATRSRAGSGAE
ncbi:glycosyltransferase family 2 protein [Aciditerrimonas ferrireducens]|uniref:glycosyltransferase family 2 protein n=1 Tax=Aciditerrimonas ferrireducens TaxID=667306 RepID=UPI0020065210|nr:glycosyltransferase family 2 protein [Aciditerrimonas ferrireducens]MCK4177423.1 glycosyltransferase family 2 protein [Aciditerrimonas ferrireducens]